MKKLTSSFIAILLCFLITSCSKPLDITTQVAGPESTVQLPAHIHQVMLSLESNPTTGYQWFVNSDSSGVKITMVYHAGSPGRIGRGGVEQFNVKLPSQFESIHLSFLYARSFEKNIVDVKTVVLKHV